MDLQFACQPGCTRCCETHGFVYITERDLRQMAEFSGMAQAAFESAYVVRYRHVLRLKKPRGSQCHFLRSGGCSVHPVKPTQCRLYPFWPELVENRTAWRIEQLKCPGIGTGELIQIGKACETASEMKTAYPKIYPQSS